jgi:hypothetical protein
MQETQGGNMKVLSKAKVLAERNSWSMARAQGYVDGEISRRRGATPSKYAQIGIDDYSLGFRAGYYERNEPRLTNTKNPAPATADGQRRDASTGAHDI